MPRGFCQSSHILVCGKGLEPASPGDSSGPGRSQATTKPPQTLWKAICIPMHTIPRGLLVRKVPDGPFHGPVQTDTIPIGCAPLKKHNGRFEERTVEKMNGFAPLAETIKGTKKDDGKRLVVLQRRIYRADPRNTSSS